jgi:hypothetical protein
MYKKEVGARRGSAWGFEFDFLQRLILMKKKLRDKNKVIGTQIWVYLIKLKTQQCSLSTKTISYKVCKMFLHATDFIISTKGYMLLSVQVVSGQVLCHGNLPLIPVSQ